MHPRRLAIPSLLALLGALAVSAPSLDAQQMTNPSDYPIGFGFAAGLLIPSGSIGDVQSTGWNLQGFVDWTSRTQPFGLRGDISYGSLQGKDISGGGTSISASDLHLFSITGDGVWMIHPAPGSTSRTTPYLLAGIGLYRASFSVAGASDVDHSSTNFGINFGGGILYKLTGFSAFGEIRYHNVFSGADNGSAHYIPIMVGLRFGGAGGGS
jgi:opacity protein-like surface antigen